ncbi:MAG TPA: hypothetical protein VGA52_03380 [Anaerolineales bacterium]|jgi:hypothetical protein
MTSTLRHLPSRDVERLSVYLDGQLPEREQVLLRARLAKEPHLQRALVELQSTVRLLHSLPQVKPPRSFRLTAEMVAPRQAGWALPSLRWATAVAAFAFFSLVGVDILTSQVSMMAGAPQAAQEMPAAEPLLLEQGEQRAEADSESLMTPEEESVQSEPALPAGTPTGAPTETQADSLAAGAAMSADEVDATEQAAGLMAPSFRTGPTEDSAESATLPLAAAGPRLWLRLAELGLALLVVGLAWAGWRLRRRTW